jgi:hypothetical protein
LSPAASSPTRLTRSRPNADGEFTLAFENPKGLDLEAGKHQVIFQVLVGKPVRERIFRQLDVKAGRYEEKVKINPDWIDDSRVSITFVTVQPNHNDWVRAFFLEGKGTSYKGIWTADGGTMPEIVIAKKARGLGRSDFHPPVAPFLFGKPNGGSADTHPAKGTRAKTRMNRRPRDGVRVSDGPSDSQQLPRETDELA